MPPQDITSQFAVILPRLILCVALLSAIVAGNRYLDAIEQVDLRETDTLYLARLDFDQQRQYRDYRDHYVSPDAAARWVREQGELRELKQSIMEQELVIQASVSRERASQ